MWVLKETLSRAVIEQAFQEETTKIAFTQFEQFYRSRFSSGFSNIDPSPSYQIMNSPINRGIILYCNEFQISDSHWKGIYFYLIQSALDLGYSLQKGEVRTMEESGSLSLRYFTYVKPKISFRVTKPQNQLYGNLTFELFFVNDQIQKLKILSNVYQGRDYELPLLFEDFFAQIFESRK